MTSDSGILVPLVLLAMMTLMPVDCLPTNQVEDKDEDEEPHDVEIDNQVSFSFLSPQK